MNKIIEDLESIDFARERAEAFQRAMHRTLAATEDYTRRIHWWVRLFGIIWIVVPAVAALMAVAFTLTALIVSGS